MAKAGLPLDAETLLAVFAGVALLWLLIGVALITLVQALLLMPAAAMVGVAERTFGKAFSAALLMVVLGHFVAFSGSLLHPLFGILVWLVIQVLAVRVVYRCPYGQALGVWLLALALPLLVLLALGAAIGVVAGWPPPPR